MTNDTLTISLFGLAEVLAIAGFIFQTFIHHSKHKDMTREVIQQFCESALVLLVAAAVYALAWREK